MRFGSQGLQTTFPFGPAPAHANLSAGPESGLEKKTPATSGRKCFGSSASVALTALLASRSRRRFGSDGSMEYSETWKEKVTPAGRSYWAHTASGRRISGNGCTGWPSPRTADCQGGVEPDGVTGGKLLTIASKAGWPTPNTPNGGRQPKGGMTTTGITPDGIKRQVDLGHVAKQMAGWGTPRVTTNGGYPSPQCTGKGSRLEDQAAMAGWATPTRRDWKSDKGIKTDEEQYGSKGRPLPRQALGTTPDGSPCATGKPGGYQLNPFFPLHLMGFPVSWGLAGIRSYLRSKRR